MPFYLQMSKNITQHIYIYIYICMYIYIYITHTHAGYTGFTFTQSFPAGFTWSLSLVETPCPIVNLIQVIDKEARAT